MKHRYLALALAAFALAGCPEAQVDHQARGAELLAPFKMKLKGALLQGMESGPAEAIGACRAEAPQIAASLSTDGVRMGRSSHKLRNPQNAPPDWLVPILEAYASTAAEHVPQLADLGDGRSGYAEPIIVQPLCLTCHGETLHPDVAGRIAELYPEDEATGFAEGDFRGVFWVEY